MPDFIIRSGNKFLLIATSDALTAPTGLTATAISPTAIWLSWSAGGGAATGFVVDRSPDGSTWAQVAATPATATSYTDNGLSASGTYYYRVAATNANGTSPFSNTAGATTPAESSPTAPTGLLATPSSSTQINLTWTDTSGGAATGFLVERSPDGASWSQVGTTTGAFYSDTGRAAGTAYYYRVAATNAYGTSAFSNTAEATTPAATAPYAPAGLTATAVVSTSPKLTSQTRAVLQWTDHSERTATEFLVERSSDGSDWSQVGVVAQPTVTFQDSGLSPGTTYDYRVRASGPGGLSGYCEPASATTAGTAPPASAPAGFVALPIAATAIFVTWDTVPETDTYLIQQSTDGGTTWTTAIGYFPASDPTRIAQLGGYTPGQTYQLRVLAVNVAGDGPPSAVATVTMPAAPASSYPTTPSMLCAATAGPTSITLTWSNDAVDAVAFYIFRVPYGAAGDASVILLVGAASGGVTSWTDTGLSPSTTYAYRMQAVNDQGEGYATDWAFARTAAATAPTAPSNVVATVLGAATVALTWNDDATTETGYLVQRSPHGQGAWTSLATLAAGSVAYTDTTASAGTAYDYQVAAINAAGSSASAAVTVTTPSATPPAAPTNLAVTATGSGSVSLAWTAGGLGDGVAIERAPDVSGAPGAWAPVLTIAPGAVAFLDGGLAASTTYHYRVKVASLAHGDSAYSNAVSAATTQPAGYDTAPNGAVAYILGPTSAQVAFSWDVYGGILNGFAIESSPDGSTGWTQVGTSIYSPATATGLPPGTVTYLRVRGLQFGVPKSDYSNTVAALTWPASYATPVAPSQLVASVASPTSVALTWTDNSGGTAVTLIERTDDGLNWHEAGRAAAGTTSYLDDDPQLVPGGQYGYAVRALGLGGLSDATAARPAATPAHLDPTVALVNLPNGADQPPSAPGDVAAYAASDTMAWVAWTINDDAETGFDIEVSTDGATWSPAQYRSGRTTTPARWTGCYVSGLAPMTSYQFRVASYNAAGHSAYVPAASSIVTLMHGQVWSPTGRIPLFILNPEWYAGAQAGLADYLAFRGYPTYAAWKAAGYPTTNGSTVTGPSTWAGQAIGLLLEDANNHLGPYARNEDFPIREALAYQITGDVDYAQGAYAQWTTGSASLPRWYDYTGLVTGGVSQYAVTRNDLEVAPESYQGNSTSDQFIRSASQPFTAADVRKYVQITGGAGWTPGRYYINGGPDANGWVALNYSPAPVGSTGGVGTVTATTFTASGLAGMSIDYGHGGMRVWWDTGRNADLNVVGQYLINSFDGNDTVTIIPGTPNPPQVGDQFTAVNLSAWYGNPIRDRFVEFMVTVDAMFAGLTSGQQVRILQWLNALADEELGHNTAGNVYELNVGADQGLGGYFALVLLSQTGSMGNTRAAGFLTDTLDPNTGTTLPIGGLDPTGLDEASARNLVAFYATEARSGEWIQTSEYNPGNSQLWLFGVMGLRTAADVEHFPEYAALAPRVAAELFHRTSSDLQATTSWGDDEHPGQAWMEDQIKSMPTHGGANRRIAAIGPYIVNMVRAYWTQGLSSSDPYGSGCLPDSGRYYLFLDFRDTGADFRTAPAAWTAPGAHASMFVHADWRDDTSAFFQSMTFTGTEFQHEVEWLNCWDLWFRQTRGLTHPEGYTAFVAREDGINGLTVNGVDASHEIRGLIASDFGPSDSGPPEYAYQVGSTYGYYYGPYTSNEQPPRVLHERTRSIVFLPALQTGSSPTVVTYDRVHAQRADLSPDFTPLSSNVYYLTGDGSYGRVTGMTALEQANSWVPVPPTFSGARVAWVIPPSGSYGFGAAGPSSGHPGAGGFPAHCETLLPTGAIRSLTSPSEFGFSTIGGLIPNEVKFRLHVSPNPPLPPTNQPRQTRFLQLWQAYDAGTMTNALVQSSAGEAADGALIQRTGEPDALVLFGSGPLDRTFRSGFTVSWTSSASSTLVYPFDLDRSRAWVAAVDGGASTPLTPSAAGVGRIAVAGAGPHTLSLSAT